ncbi:HD domain-containing protein [Candidatus Poribacteria bacterium]
MMNIPHNTKDELLSELSVLTLDSDLLIRKALDQAFLSHHAQERDDGSSYLEQHIYPVALSVIKYCQAVQKRVTSELAAGALLHDVLEDDDEMTDERFRQEFGEKVFSIVSSLTKPDYREYPGDTKVDKKHVVNREYFEKLEGAPAESQVIKLADRLNNISCIHLSPKAGKLEFYVEETETFYLPFAEKVSKYYYSRIRERIEKLRAS